MKKNTKLKRLTKIIIDLFPQEELEKYERDGIPLEDQFMNYCLENKFTKPLVDSKKSIEKMALYLLHEFFKSNPKAKINFEIFDAFFL